MVMLGILVATVFMFLWGRWRHDMVAAGALLAAVLAGLVPGAEAFAGFGHPAVITVACVLVLSQGLINSGAVDALVKRTLPGAAGPTLTIAALTGTAAILSGFMNNVGALALLMPVALQIAVKQGLPPGRVLMPLAFGSILGGMTTMIGTPPNLIVSGFRAETGAGSFTMFDFTPVGLAVAVAGVLFVAAVGWRLVPVRERSGAEGFETEAYLTEARVTEDSKVAGMSLREIDALLKEEDAQVVGLVRNEFRLTAPARSRVVRVGDILVVQAEADVLGDVISGLGLKMEAAGEPEEAEDEAEGTAQDVDEGEAKREAADGDGDAAKDGDKDEKPKASEEIVLGELAVLPQSVVVGRSATDMQLRTRYGINLLAVSRRGQRSMKRLRTTEFQTGDVLLMQGSPDAIADFASESGLVPLAERALRIPDRRQAVTAVGIMLLAVGGAAFGLLPAAISFAIGVLASMALRTVPLRKVYEAIDWPVVVLLAALIPVAGAMATTGTADLIARLLIENLAQGHAIIGLVVILLVTMTLSDLMNNAATAAVMCPIAIGTASHLGVNADPFLMAVAVGASCAFLTPIGHQNNTLILGPGGFRFGDYWRLGLPVEILVVAVSIPMLLLVWPL
jgi:di/tricarboxylate transporter